MNMTKLHNVVTKSNLETICAAAEDCEQLLLALKQSEAHLRVIADALPVMIAYIDCEEHYRFNNEQYARVLGRPLNQITNQRIEDVLGPQIYADIRTHIHAAVSGRTVTFQSEVIDMAGETRRLEAKYIPQFLPNGDVQGFVSLVTDITEYKQTEEALRESEQLYRNLIDTAEEGVWIIDANHLTRFVNPKMAQMLSTTIDQMNGTSLFDFMDETGCEIARKNTERRRDGISEHHDFKFRCQDGSVLWTIVSTNPFFDAQGNYAGSLAMLTDITDRKLLEEKAAAAYQREQMINKIGQTVLGASDPEMVQSVAVQELGYALGVDRCFFRFFDETTSSARVGCDWHREDLQSLTGEIDLEEYQCLVEEYTTAGETIVTNDVMRDNVDPLPSAALRQLGLRAAIRVPVFDQGLLVASLGVGMTDAAPVWTPEEIALVETVAAQARSAVETARLHQREHQIATILQSALQPPIPARVPGVQIASYYKAALNEANIGGDFSDVFTLNDHVSAFVIGDVSGKGLAAATQVSMVRNMLRGVLYRGEPLAQSITELNTILTKNELLSGFVTLSVALYDAVTHLLTYVICGHEPSLLRRADGNHVEILSCCNPPLGINEASIFQEKSVLLDVCDLLVLYTDGISEAGCSRLNLFGVERLAHLLTKDAMPRPSGRKFDAECCVASIVADVEAYTQGLLRDDACIVAALIDSAE